MAAAASLQISLPRWRSDIAALKEAMASAKTVQEYHKVTEGACRIVKAAVALSKQAMEEAVASSAAAAAAEAGAGAGTAGETGAAAEAQEEEEASAAAAVDSSSGPLPARLLVMNLPAGWSSARARAFIERSGVRPLDVHKEPGCPDATATFGDAQQRAHASTKLRRMQADGRVEVRTRALASSGVGNGPGAKRAAEAGGAQAEEPPPKQARAE